MKLKEHVIHSCYTLKKNYRYLCLLRNFRLAINIHSYIYMYIYFALVSMSEKLLKENRERILFSIYTFD